MYEAKEPYSFKSALERTLKTTQDMFERQRKRMLNYEYRMEILSGFIDRGLMAIIIGTPVATFIELKNLFK